MSEIIARESQLLEQDARVTLFELDTTDQGQGIQRFTPEAVGNAASVMFGGNEYLVIPIEADGFEWNGKGTMPRPTLTITAMNLAFLSLVLSADDLVGVPVKRIRTYRKCLDDGTDPDPSATFPPDYYVIERKTRQKPTAIQFELSVKMDHEGLQIPARQVLRDTCGHRYRWWDGTQYRYEGVTCPYAGTGEYQRDGTAAATGGDNCGKRLSDCRKRFGQYGDLPFYGFPGVARFR
ncbi:MAG: phage minor tail protein L [Halomonadaceae bacterium]|nr:phage minor tail protein L [Halomonadaceae bacterium]